MKKTKKLKQINTIKQQTQEDIFAALNDKINELKIQLENENKQI